MAQGKAESRDCRATALLQATGVPPRAPVLAMWDIRSLSQGQCCQGKEEPGRQGRKSWQSITWSGTEGPSLGDLEKHVTQGTPWDPEVGRTGGPGPELGAAQ